MFHEFFLERKPTEMAFDLHVAFLQRKNTFFQKVNSAMVFISRGSIDRLGAMYGFYFNILLKQGDLPPLQFKSSQKEISDFTSNL